MWVALHVHSQYSILDASASVQAIANQAAAFGMPACALTDHGNMFGAVDFYKACSAAGVKPILGCEVYVAPRSRLEKKKEYGERAAFHLTLLAKNNEGYNNLCKLTSLGYLEGFYYHPRVDHELIEKYSGGLICLSGCLSSRLAHEALEGTHESVSALVDWYLSVFRDDFYLEMQRHPMTVENIQADGINQEAWLYQHYNDYIGKQERLNTALREIAKERSIPLAATNDSHFIERSDWRAHEILLNVQSGEPCETWERDAAGKPTFRTPNPKRRTYPSHECYFKSPQEMHALFHDIPEALSSTLQIAEKCKVALDFEAKHYPVFIPPSLENRSFTKGEREKGVEKFLWDLCEQGIPKRYTPARLKEVQEVYPGRDPKEVVRERLKMEMDVIAPKGMCDYLLIVWDFINWAKRQNIPVGPGRGSGAGSIVLYLIGVTDIEPLRFHLFFERFINPERISYPDIDVDICMERRGDVIQYTLEKYGKDNVAQIITFGTMKAKMVIRDVGRVLSVPLSKVNAIAKLVPEDLNITLDSALEKDPDLKRMYDTDEETKRIFDLGRKIEGSIRNTGIHAAGIIVSGEPLTELIPLCTSKDSSMPVTQYSMKPVELVGMLKIDFLGLKTLTAIQLCVDAIRAGTGKEIPWTDLPLDDSRAYSLLNQGKTHGVFQFESQGFQELVRNLHLDKFEEIIAVGALYRPGPMDMIPSYINRKHGREPIEYDHPWMKDILAETYGIMVYQEQVMQIASKLANYSLGEGDVLRRAMGKKEMAQMAKQREKFREGALKNGIGESVSMHVFDKMEKFAAYGFNKSHAAAYGYITYVTAYLKANYPKEWMAALMTCDSHDITKVAKYIRECHAMNIAILPPDINEAGTAFVSTRQGIRFAMSAVKGVGTGVVAAIVEERKKKGKYKDFYDLITRIDTRKVGKKMIEILVDAGCCDFAGWPRDALKQSIEPMFETAARKQKDDEEGVMSLFSLLGDVDGDRFSRPPEVKIKSTKNDLLLKEKQLLGFFLTGHPMDAYKDFLGRLSCIPLRRVEEMDDGTVFRSAFIVETVSVRYSAKTQKKFAILTISDGLENFELPIWPDLYEEKHMLLLENQLLYAVLQVERQEGAVRLSCRWFDDLTRATDLMIAACDRAYDSAKQMAGRRAGAKRAGPKSNAKPQQKQKQSPSAPAVPGKMQITLDAANMRLSHVLKIQEILKEHQGPHCVVIDFHVGGKRLAALHVNASIGVTPSPQLESALKALPSLLSVSGLSSLGS